MQEYVNVDRNKCIREENILNLCQIIIDEVFFFEHILKFYLFTNIRLRSKVSNKYS